MVMMSAATLSIAAEPGEGSDGHLRIHLKIGLPQCELNLCLDPDEISKLAFVLARPWVDGAIAIGTCLGVPAHWSSDDGMVSILVGPDDQTWDVGVELPAGDFPNLRLEVERCCNMIG